MTSPGSVPQSPRARRARWRPRVGHKLAARASRSAFAAASRPGGRQHRKRGGRRRRPARRSTAPTIPCQENSKPASPSSASPSRPTTTRAGVQHRAGAVCRSGVSATSPRPTWTCANAAANRGGELLAVALPASWWRGGGLGEVAPAVTWVVRPARTRPSPPGPAAVPRRTCQREPLAAAPCPAPACARRLRVAGLRSRSDRRQPAELTASDRARKGAAHPLEVGTADCKSRAA
jgi:hypothetical protein